jgi:hypothetical protein
MICFLLSNMGFLLCTVEINIPNDKFIIHQVKEVVIEGKFAYIKILQRIL